MLQAHSFLWHYGWVGPYVLTLALAAFISYRGLRKQFPVFFSYLIFVSLEEITLYLLDISPNIKPITWWWAFWVGTIVEGLLKFAVVAELLQNLLHPWPSVAKLVRNLVSGAGVLLVFLAAVAAAFAAPDKAPWIVGGVHILSQTLYLTQAGLIVSVFVAASIFKIPWDRHTFGIALGLAVVWCGHLAVWALVSGGVVRNQGWEDLANMATYHISVLIWCYYLLVPGVATQTQPIQPSYLLANPSSPLPGLVRQDHEEALNDWNRELERFIH